jgi:hypothetical protein
VAARPQGHGPPGALTRAGEGGERRRRPGVAHSHRSPFGAPRLELGQARRRHHPHPVSGAVRAHPRAAEMANGSSRRACAWQSSASVRRPARSKQLPVMCHARRVPAERGTARKARSVGARASSRCPSARTHRPPATRRAPSRTGPAAPQEGARRCLLGPAEALGALASCIRISRTATPIRRSAGSHGRIPHPRNDGPHGCGRRWAPWGHRVGPWGSGLRPVLARRPGAGRRSVGRHP